MYDGSREAISEDNIKHSARIARIGPWAPGLECELGSVQPGLSADRRNRP